MNRKISKLMKVFLLVIVIIIFSGCSVIDHTATEIKGNISGNEFIIDTFDNNGNLTMKTSGKKITVKPNLIEELVYTDNGFQTKKKESQIITILIDDKEIQNCGDTCIFYDKELIPDYEYFVDDINSNSKNKITENPILSASINKIKNYIGKSRVVVIKSQLGNPIYVFSGENVYWEVDKNLPKFTKLLVDGKKIYIHRANFQIIDKTLIDN